jgi:hypothetical protein
MPSIKTCEKTINANYRAIKRMRLEMLALAVCLLAHVLLTGCGGGAGSSETPSDGECHHGAWCYLYAATYVYCDGDIDCALDTADAMIAQGWQGCGSLMDALIALDYTGDICGVVFLQANPNRHYLIRIDDDTALETSWGVYTEIPCEIDENNMRINTGPYAGDKVLLVYECAGA